MKLSHICLLGVSALMFWACANRYSSPILIERGEGRNEYEREYFAIKEAPERRVQAGLYRRRHDQRHGEPPVGTS